MKAGKIWGWTTALLATPLIEIHRLQILPYAQCSLHTHAGRWNAFVVTAGRLLIEVHQRDYDLVDTTELGVGELTTVPPGLPHRFRTEVEGAECFEVYYPAALGSPDITRMDVGSCDLSREKRHTK